MYTLLIIFLLVGFSILAWRDLKLALTVLLALLPTYLLRFEIVIPWTVLEGFILIAFAVWIIKTRPTFSQIKTWFGPYLYPLLAIFVVATAAIIWSPDTSAALGIWKAYYLEPLLVFVMLRSTFTDKSDWLRALFALATSVVALAGVAIFQSLTGLGLPPPWDIERRATSVFEYPNALGLFVAPVVASLLVYVTTPPTPPYTRGGRVGIIAAIMLGIVAIVLAKTEAAVAALMLTSVVILPFTTLSKKTKIVLGGVWLIVALGLLAVPAVRSKLILQDYSGNVRLSQWQETSELLKDRPILGAGLSGYPTAIEPYHDPRLYEIFQYPHNILLNVWVELGILGVVVGCWLLVVVIKVVWWNRRDPIVLAGFAALLIMVIHGLVDVPFFKNDLAVLTVFFLAMTLHKKSD